MVGLRSWSLFLSRILDHAKLYSSFKWAPPPLQVGGEIGPLRLVCSNRWFWWIHI